MASRAPSCRRSGMQEMDAAMSGHAPALIGVPPGDRPSGMAELHVDVCAGRAGTARAHGGWLEAQHPGRGPRPEAVAATRRPGDGTPKLTAAKDTLQSTRRLSTAWRCRVCKAQFGDEMTIPQLRLRLSSGQRSGSWPCACPLGLEAAGCRLAFAYALLGSPADTARFGLAADVVAAAGGSFLMRTSRSCDSLASEHWRLALQLRVLDRILEPAYTLHSTLDAGLPNLGPEHRAGWRVEDRGCL